MAYRRYFYTIFEHNHVLHEQIVILTIVTKDVPYVDVAHRIKVRAYGNNQNFYRVKLYYGFPAKSDVRQALEQCTQEGLNIDFNQTSFFIGSERISFRKKKPHASMAQTLIQVFIPQCFKRNRIFQKFPFERVIELGIRIELLAAQMMPLLGKPANYCGYQEMCFTKDCGPVTII